VIEHTRGVDRIVRRDGAAHRSVIPPRFRFRAARSFDLSRARNTSGDVV
jgi:hypothetical protein